MDARSGSLEKEPAFQAERSAKIGPVEATPDRAFGRHRKSPLLRIFSKEMLSRSVARAS